MFTWQPAVSVVRFAAAAASCAALLAAAGCTASAPTAQQESMTREQSKSEVTRVFRVATAQLDASGWEVESTWLSCTHVAAESVRFTVSASRIGPLPGTAREVIDVIATSLSDAGFVVEPQHEQSGDLWALGFPNGFLGGRAADGSGFTIAASDAFLSIDIDGHCVSGEVPKAPDDPLRSTPSPFAIDVAR